MSGKLCGHRSGSGRACRRKAGAGTDHPGEGLCDRCEAEARAERDLTDPDVRAELLAYIRDHHGVSVREAAAAVGVKRKDVKQLRIVDAEFEEDYREARGWAVEQVEDKLVRVALDDGNPSQVRAATTYLRAHHPAYRDTRTTRLEGQVDVRAVPYIDFDRIGPEKTARVRTLLAELRELAAEGAPDPDELPRDGRPALELLPAADAG